MTRQAVSHALERAAGAGAFAATEIDADGTASIVHAGGASLVLAYAPAPTDMVVLYAETDPVVDREAAFRAALESMHLWRAADGLAVGLKPGTDQLTVTCLLPASEPRLAELIGEAVDRVAAAAIHWEAVARGGVPGDAQSAGENEVTGLGAGAIRV